MDILGTGSRWRAVVAEPNVIKPLDPAKHDLWS